MIHSSKSPMVFPSDKRTFPAGLAPNSTISAEIGPARVAAAINTRQFL